MATVRHPATYTDTLLPVMADMLPANARVLDPFGGTGKIFKLLEFRPDLRIEAIEIEPEWASLDSRITLGNALMLPWQADSFDAICTSPCYGNRMADHHEAKDASRRNTYRHALGRPLSKENAGAMQWGDAYRDFHRRAWLEAKRVLRPRGTFILNIKDHVRAGKCQQVSQWHVDTLFDMGFSIVDWRTVETPGQRYGANGGARLDHENVIAMRLLGI